MAPTGVNACPFFSSMDERRRYDDHLAAIRPGGWAAHAARAERAVALIRPFVPRAEERRWSVANQPALAVARIEPPPGSFGCQRNCQAHRCLKWCPDIGRGLRGARRHPRLRHQWWDYTIRRSCRGRAVPGVESACLTD
jgi:hypothetical protein